MVYLLIMIIAVCITLPLAVDVRRCVLVFGRVNSKGLDARGQTETAPW